VFDHLNTGIASSNSIRGMDYMSASSVLLCIYSIYGIFNDAVSNSSSKASNGRVLSMNWK
jgi:hypothetical protein